VDQDGRTVALKVLPKAPGNELRALATVCHPAVVGVIDGGGTPVPFLAMELARGRALSDVLARSQATERQAVEVVAVLADALATVHHAGIVHGDVKPENVMVESLDPARVMLVDFGLAMRDRGGTALYAAPELLRGATGPSMSADVYGLGLMLWEMLHRGLPWAHLPRDEALLRRLRESPVPGQGAPWLRELLAQILALDPALRPSAADVADALASHGARIQGPDADLLFRRSRTVHVPRRRIHEVVSSWLDSGGVLALVGPDGSGRTHLLDRIHTELRARGRPCVRMVQSERPWSAVEQLLADPGLDGPAFPLPTDADPEVRAQKAAAALEMRARSGLTVLVDDVEELDLGSTLTLVSLAAQGWANIVGAGASAPSWARVTGHLEPLDLEELEVLATGILGASSSLEGLVRRMLEVSDGLPGPAAAFVIAAARHGAVVRRAYRWHVDEDRLGDVPADVRVELTLGKDALMVGAFLALHGLPIPLDALAKLADLSGDACVSAVRELEDARFAVLESGLARCRGRSSAEALRAACADPPGVHRTLLGWVQTRKDVPLDRVGWHAAGCGDPKLASSLGPSAIVEAMAKDVGDAARLADALWEVAPVVDLEGLRMDALLASGRSEDARRFGEEVLASREPSEQDVPVLVALVRLHAGVRGDDQAAMACIERARAALGSAPLPLELAEAEAQAHFRADRIAEAIEVASQVPRHPEGGDVDDLDRWLRLRGLLAQCLHRQGDVESAIRLLEAVPPKLGRGRVARATLYGVMGRLLWHAGRLQEAREAMEVAGRKDAGLPTLERARMLNNAGLAAYQTGDRMGALTLWEKALFLFERLDAPVEQVRAQVNLCVAYREAGRWERARLAGQWALSKSTELGLPEYEAMAAGNLGDLYLAREAWEEADRWYDRAHAIATRHELYSELVELARRRAQLAVSRRDPDALRLAMAAEEAAGDSPETLFERCRATALVAVCLARKGVTDEVDDLLQKAIEPLKEAGAAVDLAEVRLWAAEAYLAAGRTEDALAQIPRVMLYAEEVGHLLLRVRAERLSERARARTAGPPAAILARLVELGETLAQENDLPMAMEAIVGVALEVCGADRAFVIARDGDLFSVMAARARGGIPAGEPAWEIVKRSILGARKIVAADLSERSELLSTTSATSLKLRSVMCVPLVHEGSVVGAVCVDSVSVSEHELSELDLFMRAIAVHATAAITRDREHEAAVTGELRARELIHDMRNVMSPVFWFGRSLLETNALDNSTRTDLEHVVDATREMVSIANRFVEGRGTGVLQALELGELLGHVVSVQSYNRGKASWAAPSETCCPTQCDTVPKMEKSRSGFQSRRG
jgi:tetratricopeptide (TPR) repeat protein